MMNIEMVDINTPQQVRESGVSDNDTARSPRDASMAGNRADTSKSSRAPAESRPRHRPSSEPARLLYDPRAMSVKPSASTIPLRGRQGRSIFWGKVCLRPTAKTGFSGRSIGSNYQGSMWMTSNTRYIRILLLVLFACSSLASPSLFVLCTGDGGAARIAPFHVARDVCSLASPHQCCRSAGLAAEIVHNHGRCSDFRLSGHIGLVKERERLPELLCLSASASPAGNSDLRDKDGIGGSACPAPVSGLANHFPDSDLESIVLII